MVIRFATLVSLFALAYFALLFKLYDVQLLNGEYYLARAESQLFASTFLEAKRGALYFTDKDKNNIAIAINKDFPIVFGAPKDIEDSSEVAYELAPILKLPIAELLEKLSKKDDPYEVLANKVDQKTAYEIDNLKIKGIYVSNEPQRVYPFGSLASHLLGFVGPQDDGVSKKGHYGLEAFFEDKLAGMPGEIQDGKVKQSHSGEDIILTIDLNIQGEAEKILEELVGRYGAQGGGVIVMEPKTGKLLALAGLPNFNPNNYSEANLANFVNPMVQNIYEPGSVFKLFTMAAGIDSGKITPETTYIDTGTLTLNGRTIQNYDLKKHGPYGRVTMTNVIEHSINTGAVFAERQIGREVFKSYLEKFGLGEKTAVELPGEVKGDLRQLSPKEKDIAFATASYGQGVAVTPLALIRAVAAIANKGNLITPYLTEGTAPKIVRRVITSLTARKVKDMMVSAVDGADVAKISGYTVAGKTGTAFIPDFKKGGYTEKVINTYIGFAPASDSQFIILLKLDEPEGAPVAALTVVPAFRDLAQFILNYYNIPPDRLATNN